MTEHDVELLPATVYFVDRGIGPDGKRVMETTSEAVPGAEIFEALDEPRFTQFDKHKAASREVGYRKRVFKRLVANGKMTQETAEREIAIMEDIAKDYSPPCLL